MFVYEDENLVVVDKPPGIPVIAPEGGRGANVYDVVTDHIRRSNPKGRAAVVHRLDRDTSGIVVFAKNAKTKKLLMDDWDGLVRERRYVALIEGRIEGESGRLDSWLAENRGGQVYQTVPGAAGAKRAITAWRALERGEGYTLLELFLETGRKHQIRAQLSAAGHPVAGDPRYGSRRDPAARLCLHAASIALDLPEWLGGRLRFESPAPPSFRAALRRGR